MKTFISIIICTYNRCAVLEKMLLSLLDQERNGSFDFEVIVVDNNSNDATKDVVSSFQSRFNGFLRYILETMKGKPFALNRGIKEAKGQILVFSDDDVTLDKRWLLSLVECFDQQGCDGVGGRVLPIYPPEKTPAWVKEIPHELAGVVVICDFGEDTKPFVPEMEKLLGANFAFKKEVFEEQGPFRTDLAIGSMPIGEDTELVQRLWRANKKLYYCGKAVVWHPVDLKRLNLKYMAKWQFILGRVAAKNEYAELKTKLIFRGGVPQYLLRGVVQDAVLMVLFCWNRRKFLRHFRGLFRKIGMIKEYRMIHQGVSGGPAHA